MALVRVDPQGAVWRLVLDHPPANAIDLPVVEALRDALAAAEAAPECRAIVLTGGGRFFSAGIDVKAVPAYDAATRAAMLRAVNATLTRFYGLPKPAVAAVNGPALGAGLVAALACDVRLAAAGDYRLGLTEASAGIPFPAVPRLVVEAEVTARAARLATVLGEAFDPVRAATLELVDAVVPADRLGAVAAERALAMAAVPALVAVKLQMRRAVLERMRTVVDTDAEPLLAGWL